MAILNYANTYIEVSDKVGMAESNTGEYIKLYFTKDGHLITHGLDYLKDYSDGVRGLVPNYLTTIGDYGILTKTGWNKITTSYLPIASELVASAGTIFNSEQVQALVNNSFLANDAMRFKGSIQRNGNNYSINGGAEGNFIQECSVGDTYRITSAGIYLGDKQGEVGDLLICIKDGSTAETTNKNLLNSSTYWVIVQANINGEVTHTINGESRHFYSRSTDTFSIFGPTSGGTENQVLLSKGEKLAPVWAPQSSIIAGGLTQDAQNSLLKSVSLGNTGIVSVTVGGTTKSSSAASGNWNINAASANKVNQVLAVGNGLMFGTSTTDTYNGSTQRTINLKPATTSTLGGVIIDDATITVDSTGKVSLTQDNIITALGYIPGNSTTEKTYTVVLADTATATATANSVNPFINLVQTVGSTKTVTGSLQLSGSGNITVTGNNSKTTISLGVATNDNYGGIKIGYTNSGKNYAVQLSEGKAFVNVPWINTTYGLATSSNDGLVPKWDAVSTVNSGLMNTDSWVLAKVTVGTTSTYDWFKLPAAAFTNTNTWRPIKLNGTQILNDTTSSNALNFVSSGHTSITNSNGTLTFSSSWRDIKIGGATIGNTSLDISPSDDIYIKTEDKSDTDGDNIREISFGIGWYNISTGEFEY